VLLTRDFIKWVVLAIVISWPVAYFVMDHWLQDFAFRISIGPWSFVLAGVLALAVAFITVGGQALRAALTNPVENLRYE
jgi:putative ABC transport system permease protein